MRRPPPPPSQKAAPSLALVRIALACLKLVCEYEPLRRTAAGRARLRRVLRAIACGDADADADAPPAYADAALAQAAFQLVEPFTNAEYVQQDFVADVTGAVRGLIHTLRQFAELDEADAAGAREAEVMVDTEVK